MKHLYLIAITLFLFGNANAQAKKWTLIGVERNKEFIVTANKKDLLKEINDNFDMRYDKLYIKSDYTIGDKKDKFYYLDIVNSYKGDRLVRWLTYKDGKFYFETTGNNDFSHLDFYASCLGGQNCQPNLEIKNNELNWFCGDKAGGGQQPTCTKEISVVDTDN